MDVYRRLTRCSSVEMLHMLEQDIKDAFGEPPKQVVVLLALTELRLLAGHFGVESIIKKDPDVVLTVCEAAAAQNGLTGAPGRLSVIDSRTIYLRMPPTFMESETLLMVLRNLMRQAYEREKNGEKVEVATAIAADVAQPSKPSPQLEKLMSLRDQGVLTDEEFEAAKKRLK